MKIPRTFSARDVISCEGQCPGSGLAAALNLACFDRAMARRWAVTLAAALLSFCYFGAAFHRAAAQHFWMDEILAVWAARLPSCREVVGAIWNGSEFSPPSYDLLLHCLFTLTGSGTVAARLPSILAIYAAAAAMSFLVARRLGALVAIVTGGFVLASSLFDYAVQARPYALLVALVATALLLWDGMSSTRPSVWRGAAIGVLLLGSVSLHFYGILGFAVIGALETVWSLTRRAIRPSLWLCLTAAALASLAWLPLIRHLAAFNAGDTGAPFFYAKPTLTHLLADSEALFVSEPVGLYLMLAIALIAAGAKAASLPSGATPRGQHQPLAVMGVVLLAVLPVAFLLGLCVTHVFNGRYAVLSILGVASLLAATLAWVPHRARVCALMIPVLCAAMVWRATAEDDAGLALDLLSHGAAPGPIVIGEALLFIELMESGDAALRERLFFLKTPPGVTSRDPANEHQLFRLTGLRHDLRIVEAAPFAAVHPVFTTLYRRRHGSPNMIAAWFENQHWIAGVADERPGMFLLTIKPVLPHDHAS